MKTMQPIAVEQLQQHDDFIYEIKYDGFRTILLWDETSVRLLSRNGIDLTLLFPEIIAACQANKEAVKELLPLYLDGELVILNVPHQANFSLIQKRGRLKKAEKIAAVSKQRPVCLMVFDLLQLKGKDYRLHSLSDRKRKLQDVFKRFQTDRLRMVDYFNTYEACWTLGFESKAEGIIAKRKESRYITGKNHQDWLKKKIWRTIKGFLVTYFPENGYFHIGIFKQDGIQLIGKCKHGLTVDAQKTVQRLFRAEGKELNGHYHLPPAICCRLRTLDLIQEELREPNFVEISPNLDPAVCTEQQLRFDMAMMPKTVHITNMDKVFWPESALTKSDLLIYMRTIYPYMKTFLYNRALTIIRCPDGVTEKCFFQKHLPDYAPELLKDMHESYILCNSVDSLLWLANHSAIEYHLPYQPIDDPDPHEIVFDLDPPSLKQFPLAIEAAQMIKQLLEELKLTSFIKTSGNKGLQIHLPLPVGKFTYEETGYFTKRIAQIIEESAPAFYTTERLKKNRGEKLYLDYVQHGRRKTIIAPYSPRKTSQATVATPLYWEEIKPGLTPERFTLENVVGRVETIGCPWICAYEKMRGQSFDKAAALFKPF